MPLTMEQLQSLVEAQNLKYFVDPQRPVLLLDVRGIHGSYRFVIALQVEGEFLQFRTVGYFHCSTDHPHLGAVLRVLGAINVERRLVKFGWDPSDGEIAAYADMWIMDGTVTDEQFGRMIHNYMPSIDLGYARIKAAAETGTDPGEKDPVRSLEEAGSSLPDELRALLDKLRGRGSAEDEEEDDDDHEDFSTI